MARRTGAVKVTCIEEPQTRIVTGAGSHVARVDADLTVPAAAEPFQPMNAARVGGAAGTHAVGGIVQPADAVAKPPVRIMLPVSTPKRRNRVVLDRGDGRQWTPPPT